MNKSEYRDYLDRCFYQNGLNPLDYMDLTPNEHIPYKLKHIKEWCNRIDNLRNQMARQLLKIIRDKNYTDNEAEFVVNSIPYKEFAERGMEAEYMKYTGYDMYQVQ